MRGLLISVLVLVAACDQSAPATTAPPTSAPTVALPSPSRQAGVDVIELPPEFLPANAAVSPDGRFVAARAKDESAVALFAIERTGAGVFRLRRVNEVRGFVNQLGWLEDSTAAVVSTDLDPSHSIRDHVSDGTAQRVVLMNIDSSVVIAPPAAKSALHHLANASPDGKWIYVSDLCCAQQILLLSRDGREIRAVVPAAPEGTRIGFVGWDRAGFLLYAENTSGRSTLVAIDVDGVPRYRVPAPSAYGEVGWGIVAGSADRAWQLLEFSRGIGSSFRELRVLVDRELRPVPADAATFYGVFAAERSLLYGAASGTVRSFDPLTGVARDLALTLDASKGPAIIGPVDGYFVWSELTRGRVADLATGKTAALPLQSEIRVSRVSGARLAEYRLHDGTIAIFDLAAWLR